MKLLPLALTASTLLAAGSVLAEPLTMEEVAELREEALKSDLAYELTEDITTELGPRMAGTEAEARAREWAVKRLNEMGFSNVRVEPFEVPLWERGDEEGEVLSPFPQKLVLTALGNSGATPDEGLTGEIVYYPTFTAFEQADASEVKGKIVFISHEMMPTQDGSGYSGCGAPRFQGPALASERGAAAIVIKSIGTDHGRGPHTGNISFGSNDPIPAAALSTSDARNLERMVKRADSVTIKLRLTPKKAGTMESGNVIAEIPGSDPDAGIVLIGGHLDSWDLGTGAIDDASGCAITAAAAKLIMDEGQPRRTIRLVWFGAEEIGIFGGQAYSEKHRDDDHAVASESDFGADRIWRFQTKLPGSAKAVEDRLAEALEPLGILRGTGEAGGGPDMRPTVANGVSAIDLNQDGTRYFDYHHTPEDTLERVDPEQLRQNLAAWTTMLAIVANAEEEIRYSHSDSSETDD